MCKVLAVQFLDNADPGLCKKLGTKNRCLGFLTADSDDVTYIALDEATKAAEVEAVYGASFYAGAANATTPYAGEVLGVLAGASPGAVRAGMERAVTVAETLDFAEAAGVPYLAHTVSSCGSFLAKEAGVAVGSALAYLIAPPLESMVALEGALKAAEVKLCKLYNPPSPTNFGGGLLTGSRSACEAACGEFARIVGEVSKSPRK
ncbi:MAG: ethanolamine utilization microcompartment protein EutL [Oscillospiraceae bacterium]|nr:ethanolamine utilization microcompartment protein EutL [Oscillospiraceae bacterium]